MWFPTLPMLQGMAEGMLEEQKEPDKGECKQTKSTITKNTKLPQKGKDVCRERKGERQRAKERVGNQK